MTVLMKLEKPDLKPGDWVRFPLAVKPWRSQVMRVRHLTISRGALALVEGRPWLSRRGWMLYVLVARDDVIGLSTPLHQTSAGERMRLLVKVSETEKEEPVTTRHTVSAE